VYILTSKYFPTNSWPDLYFPVLGIYYTEVFEFTVALNKVVDETVALNKVVEMTVYKELEEV